MAPTTDRLGRRTRKCRERVNPVKEFDRKEFQARYRLSKPVTKRLAKEYGRGSAFKGTKKAGGLTHIERLCLVMRYLATGSFYSVAGDTQKVSRTLLCRAVKDVTNYFYKNRKQYIKWPSTFLQKMKIAQKFYSHKRKTRQHPEGEEQKTPYVFGCVDGTHIPIKTPTGSQNESTYVNRKSYHSINTTVCCDYDYRIINIDPRWPGSVHDAYALRCSPMGDQIEAKAWGEMKLLGDSGYGLRKNLFTPFRTPSTPKQVRYNKWHRRNRVRVEQTIGILKQRWRILSASGGHIRHDPVTAAKIIITCACLHNVAMDHGIRIIDAPDDQWVPQVEADAQPRHRPNREREESEAMRKARDDYVQRFF